MNGIVFNEELNKNVVDFDLCNYRIDQVALSIDNNIYLNSPTEITSDIIFTVLRVDDSNNFIQKLETPDQNCYFLRVWNGLSWDDWSTPQGTGSPDGGALSVKVESNDNTISQNGNSVYNGNLRQITVNLSAVLTGYATENWVNNQGFLTQNSLNGYATESWTTQNFLKNAILNITTPDNKTNSSSTINLLNGSNIQITSDGNGNITITSTGSGGSGVTKVSSANDDINVANETTEPLLTLNSTVDGAASKIVKLKDDGSMGAINVGSNTLVINPKTTQQSTLNQALVDAYSIPNITIANTVFVGKNGSAQGTGAINNLYATIQAAIDASPANTQIYVYASGLSGALNVYSENITLKAGQVITGASSQFVVISGTVTTPANGGTCYLENLRIQTPSTAENVSSLNFAGGANVTNLQLSNVDINIYGGTGSVINYTNTNSNSKLVSDGTSAWNVLVSTSGAKLFTSSATSAGTVIIQNVSAKINDNTNNVAYSINGAVKFYHTLDNIYGQVVVSNTAAFFGTFLTIYTNNVSALITNSPTISTLNSVVMTTTANALAGTNVVEGAGAFVYYQTSTPYTTVKGFATTLNAGIGAIAAATYSIRLDSSGIAPFTAGTSDGTIQYDGSNYYVDTATQRYKLVTADFTTSKLLASWLNYNQNPTFANKTTTDVMSSSSFWAAVAQIAGSNLTYNATTGKLDATTTPGGATTFAQYSDFASNSTIAVGKIDVSTASLYDGQGLVKTTTSDIALKDNTNYLLNAVLNVKCQNQPNAGTTALKYVGTTNNPPTFAISTDNCSVNYGSITNGIFTSNAGSNNYGSIATNAYYNNANILAYNISAIFTATPYIVGSLSNASGNIYMYSQMGNTSPTSLLIKDSNNAITNVSAAYASKAGGSTGFNIATFTQPATGSTSNSTVAIGVDNLAMTWDGSRAVNHVAYSNNAMTANTPTWNQSNTLTTPITQTTWLLQAIGGGKGMIVDQTSGVTAVLDFASGTFTNATTVPLGTDTPVTLNYGISSGAGCWVLTTGAAATGNLFISINNGNSWLSVDLTGKGVTGKVNGIGYNPVNGRWVCSAWDGTTNRFYYSSSATDAFTAMTWTQASGTANQALTKITGGYLAGGGYGFAIGCISLNTNVYTTVNDTSWSIPSSIPNYSANILPYYAGGMLVCAPNFSTNPFIHVSTDGINFSKVNVPVDPYRCGSVGGNLIIPNYSSGATLVSLSFSYVFLASNLNNAIPKAAWSGTQQIMAGVGSTSGNISRTLATIANYTQIDGITIKATSVQKIGIPAGNTWFASTILGINGNETVSEIDANLNYNSNTIIVKFGSTNATLTAAVQQSPFNVGSQQVSLSAICKSGTNGTVNLNVSYADGTNILLNNSTLTITQI